MIIADDSGRDTFTVNVLNCFHREIRGDDRGFSVFLAMIQAEEKLGYGEIIDGFCSKIINNERIAVHNGIEQRILIKCVFKFILRTKCMFFKGFDQIKSRHVKHRTRIFQKFIGNTMG